MARCKVRVVMAEPAAEQSWHGCELPGPEWRSVQE